MRYEGRFYINGELIDACVEVEYGKIKRIKKAMDSCKSISGVILPSAVDLHVHFREPGFTHKEDFYTGSLSAAFGGVSFVADMPNTKPPVDSPESFEDKLALVRRHANVDFTLYSMLTSTAHEFKKNRMFKWYMYEEPAVHIPSGFVTVHAELEECIKTADSLHNYDFARPESCEARAIRRLGALNSKFHIAHISSIDSVDLCKIFGFTCEITPHHLFLHRDMELGTYGKVNPPLRAKWVSKKLWEALLSGRIDIVATDHAPHNIEEKEQDFESAPPGIPEVETYVPMFLYLVKKGEISLQRAMQVLAERPAELLNLKKGKISDGYDADFIVLDFSEVRKIKASKLHYKCEWTPYENMSAIFPSSVFLRGEKIIDDGEQVGEGLGKFIALPA